ncbi:MAG TPA: deoxyribonuclease IV [Patescibacteria group bacterium]|nr:deoxyribonuclease IV [Patescibacteria group bacterium]
MLVGGHLSIAGGYHNALSKTVEIGGNCLQIFSSSPRNWGVQAVPEEQINLFVTEKHKLAINPIYFHASYLVNFADNDRIGRQSVQTLIQELYLAQKMEIVGSIIHLGSFKQEDKPTPQQYQIVLQNVQTVLDATPENTFFIIENAGNKKLNWSLAELGFIIKELNHPRVKVCLDTCHLWGAGYDLSTEEKFKHYFDEFDMQVGIEKLEVFQINDSRDPLGSFRDRHENLGMGQIPEEEFKLLVNSSLTKDKPFILEVPGIDKKGPDKANIERFISYQN